MTFAARALKKLGSCFLNLQVFFLFVAHWALSATVATFWCIWVLKGIVHPKMKILLSFTHPQVVSDLYECLCSAEHKVKIFWRMWETEQFWGTIDFHSIFFTTLEVNGAPKQAAYKLSSKYLPLCSVEQRHSYRFGPSWGWVNDDRIFIFGWTIPLKQEKWWGEVKIYIYIYIHIHTAVIYTVTQ